MRLNRSRILLAAPAVLLLAAAIPVVRSQAGTPTYKRSALVRLDASVELKAPIAQVWAALVSPRGLSTLTGFKLAEGSKALAKVGDSAAASIKTDKGPLTCTYSIDGRELRISFEPDNASYLCESRITLQSLANHGTQLAITDRYSDDQTDTVDKTAREVMGEMAARLPLFQVIAERP